MTQRALRTRGRREAEPTEARAASETGRRRRSTLVLLSALLGFYGADRLYAGRTWSGLLKAAIGAAATAWWVVDLVAVAKGRWDEAGEARST